MITSTEDQELYTERLMKEMRWDKRFAFYPFAGIGIARLMDFLMKKGYVINVYGEKRSGFAGRMTGPSYDAVVFEGVETKGRYEGTDFNEAFTMAACRALGVAKPVAVRSRPVEDEEEDFIV